jgi:hypothetical protein
MIFLHEFQLQRITVDPDLKIQLFAVILCQFLTYFASFSMLIFLMIYGTLDRIFIYLGFAWVARNFIGLQYVHNLMLLAILKRLRLMNQGLRQIGNLNFNLVEIRRFVRWTLQCSTKIHHHLHNISEKTSLTFTMVSKLL